LRRPRASCFSDFVELAEDFQSADARQEDVEDEDVRLQLLRERQAFVAIGRRA
jgi:hypothetical protein